MQTKSTFWILPIAAAGLIGVTGCMSTGDRSSGRVMDDGTTSRRVKSALNRDPVYKYEDVGVRTYNGIVQLSGWATTSDQIERAANITERVEGVSSVINNISVKRMPTGRGAGYPYARPDDASHYDRTNRVEYPNRTDSNRSVEPGDRPDEPLPPPPNTPNK